MNKLIPFGLLAIVSMAGVADARTKVHEKSSGFDGAKTLSVAPHYSGRNEGWDSVQLSGSWSSKTPQAVNIGVTFNRVTHLQSITFNADGEFIDLTTPVTFTDVGNSGFGLESQRIFVTDLDAFRRIVSAARVWVRVTTPYGVVECPVKDKKVSPAFVALAMLHERISKEIASP